MTEIIINFVSSYITGFISSFVLLTLVYIVVWKIFGKKWGKWRIQLTQRAGLDQIKDEIINSVWVTFSGTLITVILLSYDAQGSLRFYDDINKYGGIWYVIASFIFIILFSDAWFYFFHRLMHRPEFYKYVHSVHHKSLDVTPFTVSSFHVLEATILGGWIIPLSFIVPIYVPMLGALQVVGLLNNIKSHLGYELYPRWFQKTWLKYLISSTHHNIHHTRYNGNYGLMFTFWDTWFGTEFEETNIVFEQIRSRRDVKIKLNTEYIPLKISKIVEETKSVRSVYFEDISKEFLDYLPGQYINVRMKINGHNEDRVFSLSSSPTQDNFLRITMKLNGKFTHHIFNNVKAGDTMGVMLPVGDFCLKLNPVNSINYLMIAGGSGITPLFSMIKSILYQEPDSTVTLFYANKSPETKIFTAELSDLSQKFQQFKVVDYFSKQKRLSKADISKFIADYPNPVIYTCGPNSLKIAVKNYLTEIEIDKSRIYSEDFVDGYKSLFSIFANTKKT